MNKEKIERETAEKLENLKRHIFNDYDRMLNELEYFKKVSYDLVDRFLMPAARQKIAETPYRITPFIGEMIHTEYEENGSSQKREINKVFFRLEKQTYPPEPYFKDWKTDENEYVVGTYWVEIGVFQTKEEALAVMEQLTNQKDAP